MTEKVKLTQEQEWGIGYLEFHHEKEGAIKKKIEGDLYNSLRPLAYLTLDEFVRALYIGYEVEPEFKVGDWVITGRGVLGKYQGEHNGVYKFELVGGHHACSDNLRHATPEEIAQEKERQKWAKIGRKPDEYHHYDIAYDNIHDCYVEVDDPAVPTTPFLRVANLDDKSDSREIDPFQLTLVCPADKRFDHE